ncbi:MAG: hypothetical protein ACRD2U_00415 [Terriglobales bacterium]
MLNFLRSIANVWSFALLLAVVVTLLRFIYAVYLKKIIRARRISSARSKRLLREAADRREIDSVSSS